VDTSEGTSAALTLPQERPGTRQPTNSTNRHRSRSYAVDPGLGDTVAGTILVLGTWHTVIDVDEPSLAAGLLLLLEEVHFSCGIVLIRVKGDVLCLVLEPLVSKTSHEFHCTQTNGTTDEKTFLNDSGVLTAVPALLGSMNGAAFEELGLLMLATVVYSEAVTIDD
jgi:hypothetical protein